MSELKYYKLFHRTSALTSPEFISVVEFGTGEEVYLKSEADKVIAHNKYKRCLNSSEYWVAVSHHCIDDKHRQQAERHHKRWLELAEKFKEAK